MSKAHQEYDIDDSKSHQILSKHSVDHDDHGTNKFETSAEEEEVETIAKHYKLSQGILQMVKTEKPCRQAELKKHTRDEKADTRGAEDHILDEYFSSQESVLSDSLENVEESHNNDDDLQYKSNLLLQCFN